MHRHDDLKIFTSWVFIGRTDAEAEIPILRPPHAKSWLIGKDWCWEGLGAGGEGNDRGWDGWMASPTDAHEFEWTLGVGDGQGGLACCDLWGRKELDTTERLNWTDANFFQEASGVYTSWKWGNKPGKRKITYWGSRWFPSRHEIMRTPRMVFGNQS